MKIIHFTLLAVSVSMFFTSCTSPLLSNRDMQTLPDGSYMIYREDHRGIYGQTEGQMKDQAINDASFFAKTQNMVAAPISMRSKPVGILGDWATVEYKFKLVCKNSAFARGVTIPVDILKN